MIKHLHPLPLPMWALMIVAVVMVVWGGTVYVRSALQPAPVRTGCPLHGDVVACRCQTSTLPTDSLPLDTL